MADELLEAAIAAEVELARTVAMLELLKVSSGVRPADLEAATRTTLESFAAQQAAYQAHQAANPNEPLYKVTQTGFVRLTPEEIEAHLADQAELRRVGPTEEAAFRTRLARGLADLGIAVPTGAAV